jgi:hypothetical protein
MTPGEKYNKIMLIITKLKELFPVSESEPRQNQNMLQYIIKYYSSRSGELVDNSEKEIVVHEQNLWHRFNDDETLNGEQTPNKINDGVNKYSDAYWINLIYPLGDNRFTGHEEFNKMLLIMSNKLI